MGKKFLLDLNESQVKALDIFQKQTRCTYRTDAIKKLIQMIESIKEGEDITLIAVSESFCASMFIKNNAGGLVTRVGEDGNPDIKEMDLKITYDGEKCYIEGSCTANIGGGVNNMNKI